MESKSELAEKTKARRLLSPARLASVIIPFTIFALLIITIIIVFLYKNPYLDDKIFFAVAPYKNDSNTRLMIFISFLGNHRFLIPLIFLFIFYFLYKNNKWMAIRTGVILLSSLAIMLSLKNLTQRERPLDPLVLGITNFSFPSGHSFMSVAFYGLLIWWVAISIKNKFWKFGLIILLFLLILLIGFSRIYLRVHYTTDVIAGLCFGYGWLLLSLGIMDKIQTNFQGK